MLSACFYQKLHIYVSFQLIEVRKKIECGIGMLKWHTLGDTSCW